MDQQQIHKKLNEALNPAVKMCQLAVAGHEGILRKIMRRSRRKTCEAIGKGEITFVRD